MGGKNKNRKNEGTRKEQRKGRNKEIKGEGRKKRERMTKEEGNEDDKREEVYSEGRKVEKKEKRSDKSTANT